MNIQNFSKTLYSSKETALTQDLYMNEFQDWFKYNYNFVQLCITISINKYYPNIFLENSYSRNGKEIKFDILFTDKYQQQIMLIFLANEYYQKYNKNPEELDLAHLLEQHWNSGASILYDLFFKHKNIDNDIKFTNNNLSSLLTDIFSLLPQVTKSDDSTTIYYNSNDNDISAEFIERLKLSLSQ
ncbi:MAG: hypothetical protein RLZZ546_562, partial [Bacteroidota bacterium]